jgi:geranylgeranyl diphosphate synthase type II
MEKLKQYKKLVDDFIESISKKKRFPKLFNEALFYTPKSGGKRIRAMLVILASEMFGGNIEDAVCVASSIELMHAFSLIHDDLPAMDNDDYRRGKLSNHKVFGEALAILAGDGLNTYTFEVIADSKLSDLSKIKIVKTLSSAAGIGGMVVGQAADILSSEEKLNNISQKQLVNFIHKHKTAKLIQASVLCGAMCGEPDETQLEKLKKYGLYSGVAFQIIDDYLDVVGDEKKMGKKKVDGANNTLTYPRVYGLEKSYKMANRLKDMAIESISDLGGSGGLIDIAKLIIERDR